MNQRIGLILASCAAASALALILLTVLPAATVEGLAAPLTLREGALLVLGALMTAGAWLVALARPVPRTLADLRSDLLSRLCHEFRTPLTAIKGYTELVLEDTSDAQTRADLKQVLVATASLTHLVDDVLHLDAFDATPTRYAGYDLRAAVAESVREYRRQGGSRAVEIELAHDGQLTGDRTRVVSMITGLLLSAARGLSAPILLRTTVDARDLEVWVHDGSDGLSPTELAGLSLPVSPHLPTRPGAGLPLAVTAGHLRRLRGELQVKNGPGLGAVGFRLPHAVTADARGSKPPESAPTRH